MFIINRLLCAQIVAHCFVGLLRDINVLNIIKIVESISGKHKQN